MPAAAARRHPWWGRGAVTGERLTQAVLVVLMVAPSALVYSLLARLLLHRG